MAAAQLLFIYQDGITAKHEDTREVSVMIKTREEAQCSTFFKLLLDYSIYVEVRAGASGES